MKTLVILAMLFLASASFANPGFTCKRVDDILDCSTFGLPDSPRQPEWELLANGKRIDKAEGWRVFLFPEANERNVVKMTFHYRGKILELSNER